MKIYKKNKNDNDELLFFGVFYGINIILGMLLILSYIPNFSFKTTDVIPFLLLLNLTFIIWLIIRRYIDSQNKICSITFSNEILKNNISKKISKILRKK